jgi:uncharacterized protein
MNRIDEVRDFVQAIDPGLQRTFDFAVERVSPNGDDDGSYTMLGHAAVFNRWSLDLGGFREKLDKKAFDNVLSSDPHVLHVIDHDTRFVLSSTRNKTLELSTDPKGLRYWSKVAPTSYAADLRVLLERGDISQSSFAFTVARDEWKITGEGQDEIVERTILEVANLFDVTTCAMGAYPATDSALALRSLVSGRQVGIAAPVLNPVGNETEGAPDEPAAPQTSNEDVIRAVRSLQFQAEQETAQAKERLFRGKEL